jgi:hypothetical protein
MPNGGASVLAINSLLLLIFDRQNFSVFFTFIKSEKFRGPAPSMSGKQTETMAMCVHMLRPGRTKRKARMRGFPIAICRWALWLLCLLPYVFT